MKKSIEELLCNRFFYFLSFWETLRKLFTIKKILPQENIPFDESLQVPSYVDWRDRVQLGSVKDQRKGCSCKISHAFAFLASLEVHHFIQTGRYLNLSEQEIIDCVELNISCDSSDENSFNYIMKNGVTLDPNYPYEANQRECRRKNLPKSDVKVYGFAKVKGKENLKKALDQFGPLTVKVKSSMKSFYFYKYGIFNDCLCSGASFDHEVVLLGYETGSESILDHWIIKNSWSRFWGENGYMRIAMNDGEASCIQMNSAYFPLLEQSAINNNQVDYLSNGSFIVVTVLAVLIILNCCCFSFFIAKWSKCFCFFLKKI